MNALLRKEIRLVLPFWTMAMLLALVTTFSGKPGQAPDFLYLVCGIAAGLMAVASFGLEFSHGTFSLLLAEPVSRRRIWRVKVGVLAAALLSVWMAFSLGCLLHPPDAVAAGWWLYPHAPVAVVLVVFSAVFLAGVFGCGLLATLTVRQIAAAVWVTPLLPLPACVLVALLLKGQSDRVIGNAVAATLLIQSIIAFVCARRQFLRIEDTAEAATVISLPSWFSFGLFKGFPEPQRKRRPVWASFAREYQSHRVSLFLAAVLLVFHVAALAAWRLFFASGQPPTALKVILGVCWLSWLTFPLAIGASVVAEERKLGTLEGMLCLPATRRLQFAAKWIVAIVLGVLLGGVMPWVMERIGTVFGLFPGGREHWKILVFAAALAFQITVIALYASSLARNLLQALGVAVIVGTVFIGFGVSVMEAFDHFLVPRAPQLRRYVATQAAQYIGAPVLLIALLSRAWFNFRWLQVGRELWSRNLLTLLIAVALAIAATAWLLPAVDSYEDDRVIWRAPRESSRGTNVFRLP